MSYFRSSKPIWRSTLLDDWLAALSTRPAGALLTTPKVRLLAAAMTIDKTTVLADLTGNEASFDGYTAGGTALPTLTGPVNVADNSRALLASVQWIVPASPTSTQTVYGYFLDGLAGPDWAMGEMFDAPIPLPDPGDFLNLDLVLALTSLPVITG